MTCSLPFAFRYISSRVLRNLTSVLITVPSCYKTLTSFVTCLQIGFGVQVLVTMGTFFALAYILTKYYYGADELWVRRGGLGGVGEELAAVSDSHLHIFLLPSLQICPSNFHNPAFSSLLQAGLFGSLGLTAGLLLETSLLIIRSNLPVPLHKRFPELFETTKTKAVINKQIQPQQGGQKQGMPKESVILPEPAELCRESSSSLKSRTVTERKRSTSGHPPVKTAVHFSESKKVQ
jgi:hypothetical protein